MKKITSIDVNIKALEPKLAINATDWTKEEKVHIETAYFEITKVSVGRGRVVDLGCRECLQSAVNIINNYVALTNRAEKTEDQEDWTQTLKTVHHKAEELGIEFPVSVKKKEAKIQYILDHVNSSEGEEDEEPEVEYTREQLITIVKAKTGSDDEIGDDVSNEDLINYIKELEDESEW